ncbi:hypothetical protein CDAR_22941 [Caerostris darwini]|uniref:Maturase K n=1 Tax=Caerostris darwini TaxID=1538125 RepID=A0AAV4WJE8_9ARAC|nr:hypothetical protein CDAR_22941 [Caerostris darwini]
MEYQQNHQIVCKIDITSLILICGEHHLYLSIVHFYPWHHSSLSISFRFIPKWCTEDTNDLLSKFHLPNMLQIEDMKFMNLYVLPDAFFHRIRGWGYPSAWQSKTTASPTTAVASSGSTRHLGGTVENNLNKLFFLQYFK